MRRREMTREEAETICSQYRHLIGMPFDKYATSKIDCIAVVPYEDLNKYIFLLEYKDCRQAEEALKSYTGDAFDVLVISTLVSDKVDLLTKDIYTYLQERGQETIEEMFSGEEEQSSYHSYYH